jgi:hypothetical protein
MLDRGTVMDQITILSGLDFVGGFVAQNMLLRGSSSEVAFTP